MMYRKFVPSWLTGVLQIGGLAAQPFALVLWKTHGDDYLDAPAWVALAGLTALLIGFNWEEDSLSPLARMSTFMGYLAFASVPVAVLTRSIGWLLALPICTVLGLLLLSFASVGKPSDAHIPSN